MAGRCECTHQAELIQWAEERGLEPDPERTVNGVVFGWRDIEREDTPAVPISRAPRERHYPLGEGAEVPRREATNEPLPSAVLREAARILRHPDVRDHRIAIGLPELRAERLDALAERLEQDGG